MQPQDGHTLFRTNAILQLDNLLNEIDIAVSRKRSRSVTSPTSKPAKQRKFNLMAVGGAVIEESMEIDELDDGAMSVDEAPPPEDNMEIAIDDAVAQVMGLPSGTEEVLDMQLLLDLVRGYVIADKHRAHNVRMALSTAYLAALHDEINFASKAFREGR